MNPEIITQYFQNTPKEVQDYLLSPSFDKAISDITLAHTLPVTMFTKIKNVAFLVLIGAVDTESAVGTLERVVNLPNDKAVEVIANMDSVIFEYVRRLATGENMPVTIKTVPVSSTSDTVGGGSLHDHILSTYEYSPKGGSEQEQVAIKKEDTSSRAALLEQLNLLGQIPNDSVVVERLESIKDQLESARKAEEELEEKERAARALERAQHPYIQRTAKDYAIDPYRELL